MKLKNSVSSSQSQVSEGRPVIEGVLFDLFGTLVDYEVGRGAEDFAEFCATARDLGVDRRNEPYSLSLMNRLLCVKRQLRIR